MSVSESSRIPNRENMSEAVCNSTKEKINGIVY